MINWLGEFSLEGNEDAEPYLVLEAREEEITILKGTQHHWAHLQDEIEELKVSSVPDQIECLEVL